MKNIMLLGCHGQLGWELERSLSPLGQVSAFDYPEIDLRQIGQLRKLILDIKPQVIINAAAYTAVDQAEMETEAAMAINAEAPGEIAKLASKIGALLIHYSTDYVFDGQKGSPYCESDSPNPINTYGKSKLLGEQAIAQFSKMHLIYRTSWVYSLWHESFVSKVIKMARQQPSLCIVTDQIGSPTWARHLAELTTSVITIADSSRSFWGWMERHSGLYHLAGKGNASRYEWVEAILNCLARDTTIVAQTLLPAITEEFPSPAARPLYTALDCSLFQSTFDLNIPPWKESLRLAVALEALN